MTETVLDRFLRYVQVDTRSEEGVDNIPSTGKQFRLARMLKQELEALGLGDVILDEHCYIYATLPANLPDGVDAGQLPVVGFIAHMDTAPETSAENVRPQVVDYQGGDITLPLDPSLVISPKENPILDRCRGMKIVTTDGTTLLGADDKAGVAEIMTALERMLGDPGIHHGKIRVGFTPDEEIGRGVDMFDVEAFGADVAYTMDGSELGEIENETFNAAMATFTVKGYNVHPGYANGLMVNSIKAAGELVALIGAEPSPENTCEREGYLHVHKITGSVDTSVIRVLIRDHDADKFEEKKEILIRIRDRVAGAHPDATVILDIKDSYRNMKEVLDRHPRVIEKALEAVKNVDVEPKLSSIRGGTDGARLCFMGLPTPNVFAGGHNFHGKKEFVPVPHMEKAVDVIVELVKLYLEP